MASARDVAEVWLSDPDLWWGQLVDMIVFGLEGLLARSDKSNTRRPSIKT